ncbi:uncharacterized protein LDX57_009175 [Aspergillus melleus]|uniref:uncharacterized protein n=1 Tax=Aspergillus melleus TaxID=138277 RepID=UPI001E8DCB56|nr:uncharacterized protein LDX57_009175 [Aspergillus melleus]KAH8431512.1 hypothetical protein LDX57_009175 [Aspergillus melleus]
MAIPSIRIGLLVGIGGGIPCPNRTRDIRLGDVAVSSPTGSSGGVAQYDLGKQKLNTYERVGFLAQPPNVLLKALTVVSANRMAGSSKLSRILLSLQRILGNSADFAYPGQENDWLFSASFEHRGGSGCDECQISGGPNMANQNTRLSNQPEVHYGIIASGNTVMKNAKHRDELAIALKDRTGGDCICYEMEAAGVMNDFPCLVIRGVSNYADSHKNDRWQNYAAMTAVAYAKEVLSVVPVRRAKGKKAVQVNNGPGSSLNRMHNENHKHIQHWLSPPDPSVTHNKALRQRHKDSGRWLFYDNVFIKWRTKSNSFLWLHGIPGCGKTILSSTIIEDLSDNITQSRIIFFYFDFNDINKQTVHGMIRSLVTQLYMKQIKARSPLDSLFSSCDNGKRQPTTENLCAAFLQMLETVDEIWIVLDALDECQTRKGPRTERLLSWIQDLMTSKPSNIHLLVTSRQLEDIEPALMRWAPAESNHSIKRDEVDDDIRRYIHSQIYEDDDLQRWRSRPDVQQEIETSLLEKADGM